MMTCREFIEFLYAYLDEDLPADQRAEFDEHLAICDACVDYLESYQQTIALGREALQPSEDEVPEEVPGDLIDAILAARKRK